MPQPSNSDKAWDYREWIGMRVIYLSYDRKRYPDEGVPKPYFPRTESSSDPRALTYSQWRSICVAYLAILYDDLVYGRGGRLPFNMGELVLQRFKPKKEIIDFNLTRQRGCVVKRRRRYVSTRGWWFDLKWKRDKRGFAFKRWWICDFTSTKLVATRAFFRSDPDLIFNLPISNPPKDDE